MYPFHLLDGYISSVRVRSWRSLIFFSNIPFVKFSFTSANMSPCLSSLQVLCQSFSLKISLSLWYALMTTPLCRLFWCKVDLASSVLNAVFFCIHTYPRFEAWSTTKWHTCTFLSLSVLSLVLWILGWVRLHREVEKIRNYLCF